MPLYTLAERKAEIDALKAKISQAEDRQNYAYTSGGPGSGAHEQWARGDLKAMYDRLAKLEAEYEKLELASLPGGLTNLAKFQRPR